MTKQYLHIENVSKTYSENANSVTALLDVGLSVEKGEFVCIVGASGCGKSTLLRLICGLDNDFTGSIHINGKQVSAPGLHCGIVFQEHRLLPWLTVEENIGFALHRQSKAQKKELIEKYLTLVGLPGTEKFYPGQLSGGMAQRVSIARALVNQPEILLLDEPLGALDALTRQSMQEEIRRIWRQDQTTMIMVTHDIGEAIYLGTRVVVMSSEQGRIRKTFDLRSIEAKDQANPEIIQLRQEIYREI